MRNKQGVIFKKTKLLYNSFVAQNAILWLYPIQ